MKREISLLAGARRKFHAAVVKNVMWAAKDGVPNNADKGNRASVAIARLILDQIGLKPPSHEISGQEAGAKFERACAHFLEEIFLELHHLRPGSWTIGKAGDNGIASYDQYSHLAVLNELAQEHEQLRTSIGSDYLIKPDIVISLAPWSDESINSRKFIVNEPVARYSPLRQRMDSLPLLHASISCKWTIRSDRAQNSRSEALNLIRNRKGHLPHIAVITGEPTPSRISSLALGTGDIDCVYHFALNELVAAVTQFDPDEGTSLLKMMVEGKRLRDISDLPLDLVA